MRALVIVMVLAGVVSAEAQVIAKHGTCPTGYSGQGGFCVGGSNAGPVIDKGAGSCPEGYHQSGSGYCVGYGGAKAAVTRPAGAACPSTMHSSGGACVSYR